MAWVSPQVSRFLNHIIRLTHPRPHQHQRQAPLQMRNVRSIVYQSLVSMQWVRASQGRPTCELRQKRKNKFYPQQRKMNHYLTAWTLARFSEWLPHGTNSTFGLRSLILRWTPACIPDIADALSYHWPLHVITSKSFCFRSSRIAWMISASVFPCSGKKCKNDSLTSTILFSVEHTWL